MNEQPVLLTPPEAARLLRLATQSLANMRFKRRGPKYIKLPHGGHIRYPLADLQRFLEENSINPDEAAGR